MKCLAALCLLFLASVKAQKYKACSKDLKCVDPDELCEIVDNKPVCVRKCNTCPEADIKPVCGENGETYRSFCHLEEEECLTGIDIGFKCSGQCPCDPSEIIKMDPKTVRKLQEYRRDVQLVKELKAEKVDESDAFPAFEVLDPEDAKEGDEDKKLENMNEEIDEKLKDIPKSVLEGAYRCPKDELEQLPNRLVDWFHVLKTNELRKEFEMKGLSTKSMLRELKFMDAKLKRIYSKLSCQQQGGPTAEVCLEPVRWMFNHLDSDGNGELSNMELYEIEEIHNEHCIKPFLKACDLDSNKKVIWKEFCQCLCVEPPCTRILQAVPSLLVAGIPVPFPNVYAPKCDVDGFFMPKQCHKDECWCADRNGAEVKESRTKNKLDCDDNTKNSSGKETEVIPLDVAKMKKN